MMWIIACLSLLVAFTLILTKLIPRVRKQLTVKQGYSKEDLHRSVRGKTLSNGFAEDPRGKIEPLPEFDWKNEEPIQHRPYKSKYNMTMGLANSNVSDLIHMDKFYAQRIAERKVLMNDHLDTVIGANEAASKAAVDELYTWLVGTFLPTRYPTMFNIAVNPLSSQQELFNKATSEWHPLMPQPTACETLRKLGSVVEDDFMFLMPDSDGDGYVLSAFLACFPNSFSAPGILNVKLRDIHKPVPGYKEKLELSMDRWFGKLEVGRFFTRCNWSVTPYDILFTPKGHRLTGGAREEAHAVELHPDKVFLRCERQIVHRLPQSGAIIFSVKQYIYSIHDIKQEGSGPALAEAIDGLTTGNVPKIYFYKRAAEWGDSVKAFLLS